MLHGTKVTCPKDRIFLHLRIAYRNFTDGRLLARSDRIDPTNGRAAQRSRRCLWTVILLAD